MLEIGWFATGRGEGSRGLLRFVQERLLRRQLDARIEFVFSNREPGEAEGSDEFFKLANGYGLPLVTFSSGKFRRTMGGPFANLREDYDRRVMDLLAGYRPDICVLAGYMLIVGGEMCRRYPLLNLHPALPDGPIGTWQEVVWSLIETRSSRTGAMMHLATEEVDRGPVLAYCTVPITGGDFDPQWRELAGQDLAQVKADQGENFPLFQHIRRAEYQREPCLLYETLRALAEGKVAVRDGTVVDPRGEPLGVSVSDGLCLDQEIQHALAQGGVPETG